ncbi:MAG: hypothetical protein KBF33_10145 [Comamonas sp.]|nr:hypothetical protein [Comamonas sp.]
MVTQVIEISTPPTPADPPAEFEQKAAQVWSELHQAVPQMNQQADEIEQIGADAQAAKERAIQESDAALGYRNETQAARDAALPAAVTATDMAAQAVTAKEQAEEFRDEAQAAAASAANRVAKTSDAGAALLPEGNDAQRPATGSIPAGAAVVRGNTQSPANYFLEFWNRGVSAWHVFASQPWVQGLIDAISGRVSTLESFGKCRAWVNINGTGAVTTRGAHNVSSVTWVSTGIYRVNFATPMSSTGYAVVVSGEPAEGGGNKYYGYAVTPAYATVNVYNAAGALADGSMINVAIFG